MSESMAELILKDIHETGYLTELSVCAELEKRAFSISPSRTYVDYDGGKSREIDVVANCYLGNEKLGLSFHPHLVIEVKKDKRHPWVFFMRESDSPDYMWRILNAGRGYYSRKGAIVSCNTVSHNVMIRDDKKYATSFYQAFIKNVDYSRIYEALMSACKASCYYRDHLDKYYGKYYEKGMEIYMELYVPLIVLDGTLWEANLTKSGELNLKENTWLPIQYSSPAYSSKSLFTIF